MSGRIDVHLVAGGRFHDTNFARLELLKLLAEDDDLYVTVGEDFGNREAIEAADLLVSYTCDIRPSAEQQGWLRTFLERGGRWFALHGTNSLIDFDTTDGPIEAFGVTIPGVPFAPDLVPDYMALLGSRFVTHPPIQKFSVRVCAPDHPLVAGLDDFETEDEPYCCEFYDEVEVLLEARYSSKWMSDVPPDWDDADVPRPQMYLRRLGNGEVLYLTLGHCCGKFDMQPIMEECDVVRCSWERPVYYELLRRGIRWGSEKHR
jgi:hypothetical protein